MSFRLILTVALLLAPMLPSAGFVQLNVFTKPKFRADIPFNAHFSMTKQVEDEKQLEEPLSDVDSRVLRSMLQGSKLDMETEEDIRKLLERGMVKRVPTSQTEQDVESEYLSSALKTLADTKMWKAVKAQASYIWESFGIWVSNKVEQDVKILAALGLFAWDRAVRDVARALPAAGSQTKRILLITNSSSYQESSREELNRPTDEIKSVTREVLDILSGEKRISGGSRSLRTAAPAGTASSAERLRRAYKQRWKLERQETDVTRVATGVVDAAWELRRELKAEANKPGYKTQEIRNAIEAGITSTGNMLRAARDEARILAAQTAIDRPIIELEKSQTSEPAVLVSDSLVEQLQKERSRIILRLQSCIDSPKETWLKTFYLTESQEKVHFDEQDLRSVVKLMILLRESILISEGIENETPSELFDCLSMIRTRAEEIRRTAEKATSSNLAGHLWEELLGVSYAIAELPLVLQLDEIEPTIRGTGKIEEAAAPHGNPHASSLEEYFVETTPPRTAVKVVDAETEVISQAQFVDKLEGASFETYGMAVEIVSDEEFQKAVGASQPVKEVEPLDDAGNEGKEDALTKLLLRSFDIAFFVLEKIFLVGIPKTLSLAETVQRRLESSQRSGKGSEGWTQYTTLSQTKGRY